LGQEAAGQTGLRPVVALGNFDGVHLGHREVFRRTVRLATACESPWAVVTFHPHPARVLAPELAPPLISSLERRLELIAQSGPEATIVLEFNNELAAISAEGFVRRVLAEQIGVRGVVVGYDFTFGSKREGNTTVLQALGRKLGFEVEVVEPFCIEGLVVSSTKIREFVLGGRVFAASLLLGRPLVLSGTVVHGDGRGKGLGFPTANVEVQEELMPANGVYAGWCDWEDHHHPCAVSIGQVPTFRTNGSVTVEAHILDWQGSLYGNRLQVELVRRLRPEKRFSSPKELVEQIALDVKRTREIILKL
jgi:riboflavin kinase/FMN adenylyltransferase